MEEKEGKEDTEFRGKRKKAQKWRTHFSGAGLGVHGVCKVRTPTVRRSPFRRRAVTEDNRGCTLHCSRDPCWTPSLPR